MRPLVVSHLNAEATQICNGRNLILPREISVIREGLATILALQNDLKFGGQARDGEEACLLYDELSPDILHPRSPDA